MKNVFETIKEAKTQRDNVLSNHVDNLKDAKAAQVEAEATAAKAIESGDLAAYEKAKDAARRSADRVEFYQAQINKIEKGPLFENPAERAKMVNGIKENTEKARAAKMAEAAKLINKAAGLIEETKAAIIDANNALELVAKNTGKDPQKQDIIALGTLAAQINSVLNHGCFKTTTK